MLTNQMMQMSGTCGADGTCAVGPSSAARQNAASARVSGLNHRGVRQITKQQQQQQQQQQKQHTTGSVSRPKTAASSLIAHEDVEHRAKLEARIADLEKTVESLKAAVDKVSDASDCVPWKFGRNTSEDVFLTKKPSSKYKPCAVVQQGTWALVTEFPMKPTYWTVHVIGEEGETETFYAAKRKSFTRFSSYPEDDKDDADEGCGKHEDRVDRGMQSETKRSAGLPLELVSNKSMKPELAIRRQQQQRGAPRYDDAEAGEDDSASVDGLDSDMIAIVRQ